MKRNETREQQAERREAHTLLDRLLDGKLSRSEFSRLLGDILRARLQR